MSLHSWLRRLRSALAPGWRWRQHGPRGPLQAATHRLNVEQLEDRSVPATLSIRGGGVHEGVSGTQYAQVEVRLSEPSNKTVTVNYLTLNDFGIGTATAGSDYDAVSGKLTFARGETLKTILVPIHGDRLVERNEWFEVHLQRPRGAKIAGYSGIVTILDSSPRLGFESDQRIVAPSGSGSTFMTFTVSLSAAYDLPVTLNYATSDGFQDENTPAPAFADEDYVATSGTLTFAPGETTKTITVEILGDAVPEWDEWFSVELFGASNAYVEYPQGLGFIASDW